MNIDIITAKLVKYGMVESTAKKYAAKIFEEADINGVDVENMFDNIENFSLSSIGEYLTNTIGVKGYKTGKVEQRTASDIVNRTIIK
jgi:hypothetical protein